MVDSTTFLAQFPEFQAINVDAVQLQLDLASSLLSQGRLGVWWERLCFLRAAHYLSLRFDVSNQIDSEGLNSQENQGVVTSQSANTGGLSISTSVSALISGDNAIHGDMARTNYGLEYLSLMRQILAPMVLC
jgi:hypothetical protein